MSSNTCLVGYADYQIKSRKGKPFGNCNALHKYKMLSFIAGKMKQALEQRKKPFTGLSEAQVRKCISNPCPPPISSIVP